MNDFRRSGRPVGSDRTPQVAIRPATGVIETIADGLSLVLVYPIVALIPLLVEAGLWSGITISPGALFGRWSDLRSAAETLGYETDVAPIVAVGIPSVLSSTDRAEAFSIWPATELSPDSWQLAFVTIVGLALVSSMLAMIFRVPMALIVRNERRSPRQVAWAMGIAWIRLLALVALIAATIVLIAGPLLVVSAFFLIVGFNVAPLVVAALSVPAIAALIYLTFTPDAIVLSEVGPIRAAYLSFNVVRRNFWPTLGLLGSVLLISEGLSVLWRSQIDTPIGLLIGVLGNAFVGAGLALAAMRFYDDRLRVWQPDFAGPPRLVDH